jgi:peroxiredoxin
MDRFRMFLPALFLAVWTISAAFAELTVGESAPAFSLRTPEGKTISSDDLKGKITVVHFAATWCPFCAAEAPHLEKLYADYRDRGIAVCVIDVKEPAALVAKNARKFGFSFPVLLDDEGQVARSFAPPASVQPDLSREEVMIASNLIIDREGRIRVFTLLDSARFDAKLVGLRTRLDKLLEEK